MPFAFLVIIFLFLNPVLGAAMDDVAPDAVAAEPVQPIDFQAPLLEGGGSRRLSDFRGKVVILTFWASWCGPCLLEMPQFEKIFNRFKDAGLRVVAVTTMDKRARALKFQKKNGFSFTIVFDEGNRIAKSYGLIGPPRTYVIGRDGRFVLIPDPRTGETSLHSYDPTIWVQKGTYDFLKGLLDKR